jgi:flagellar biosynthesis protein FliQ
MNQSAIVDLLRQMMLCAFWIGLPLLTIGLAAGVLISLLQILTSIQDPAFGSVPRLVAFLAGLMLMLPWMLEKLSAYTVHLIREIPRYAR